MRNTAQRNAIRRVFSRENRPLRVEEVLARAQEDVPSLNLATVYRNLKRLVDEQWLIRMEFPPLGVVYERTGKPHHHHFHCRGCDTFYEMPGCALEPASLQPAGFKLEGHEVFLYGLCTACARCTPRAGC